MLANSRVQIERIVRVFDTIYISLQKKAPRLVAGGLNSGLQSKTALVLDCPDESGSVMVGVVVLWFVCVCYGLLGCCYGYAVWLWVSFAAFRQSCWSLYSLLLQCLLNCYGKITPWATYLFSNKRGHSCRCKKDARNVKSVGRPFETRTFIPRF